MPEGANVEIAHSLAEDHHHHAPTRTAWHTTLEILEVFVLAVVAIATAWSGFQAAKWDGHQAFEYGESNRIRFEADAASTTAGQELNTDVGLFTSWLDAESVGNTDLMSVFEKRMTPDYRVAFNAWLETDPFNNPNAPAGPAMMPQYRNPHAEKAEHLNEVATHRFEDGTEARETADKYVRNTVLLAMVLFSSRSHSGSTTGCGAPPSTPWRCSCCSWRLRRSSASNACSGSAPCDPRPAAARDNRAVTRPAASLRALAAARGDVPADLLITGGRVFVPPTREWLDTDLAICDGVVVGWGRRDATEVVDVGGAALTPAFIDSHMHLESTKLWVDEFVRSVLPWGTTAVAADPHELANVFGIPGVAALVEAASTLPFTFGVCASSCVPASPFESPGAELLAADVRALLEVHGAIGVAEVMNFPGVIAGDPDLVAKIATAGHRRVDGHAPGLTGTSLDAYLAAGVESDHECTRLDEAEEKRRKGMWVFVREGSSTRNLADLIPMVRHGGTSHVALCTDDREPDLLLSRGHINDCVRLAVEHGVRLEDALVLATMNAAEYHNFHHLGQLAPGYQADLLAFDDVGSLAPTRVWQRGRLVARDGTVVGGAVPSATAPEWMLSSVHLGVRPTATELDLAPPPGGRARVIGIIEAMITTEHLVVDVTDPALDVARIGVLERHHATGRVGLGWVSGFGLARGAMASTVAHDAHNCMVVGARDESGPRDMAAAVARLAEIGGGQVAMLDGQVIAEVPLPIGGLMSPLPARDVADLTEHAKAVVHEALGVAIEAPFMHLSFLGLSVIPHLRITDKGLVDVDAFTLTDVTAP